MGRFKKMWLHQGGLSTGVSVYYICKKDLSNFALWYLPLSFTFHYPTFDDLDLIPRSQLFGQLCPLNFLVMFTSDYCSHCSLITCISKTAFKVRFKSLA